MAIAQAASSRISFLPQAEDPLGSSEPIGDVDFQQLVNDVAAGVADL
ncbi:hypothetical protein [Streptomyces sp. NPDC059071]